MESLNQTKQPIPLSVHLMAGWPLILVIFGGVIGAILGVMAYIVNRKIYSSMLPRLQKVLANLLCGMAAISLWWFIAQWIQAML